MGRERVTHEIVTYLKVYVRTSNGRMTRSIFHRNLRTTAGSGDCDMSPTDVSLPLLKIFSSFMVMKNNVEYELPRQCSAESGTTVPRTRWSRAKQSGDHDRNL